MISKLEKQDKNNIFHLREKIIKTEMRLIIFIYNKKENVLMMCLNLLFIYCSSLFLFFSIHYYINVQKKK